LRCGRQLEVFRVRPILFHDSIIIEKFGDIRIRERPGGYSTRLSASGRALRGGGTVWRPEAP